MNIDQLGKLAELRSKGTLTEAEFQSEKAKLMTNNVNSRPKSKVEYNVPRAIGFLNVALGILFIAGTFGLLLNNLIPNLDIIGISVGIQMLLYQLPLIISGIGIARQKNWGRILGMISAIIAIILITMAWVPALRENSKSFYDSYGDALYRFGNPESASKFRAQITMFAATYWLAYAYPIVLLIFSLRKKKN